MNRFLLALLILLSSLSVTFAETGVREIPLNGRLRTADDPATLGPNDFRQLTNLRYGTTYPKGVGGHTKINTSALASTGLRNGFHFRKSAPTAESHVMVWTNDGKAWKNDTAIPNAGAFTGTAWWTDASGATTGRFSNAPQGGLVYANGVETVFWGGTEFRLGGFLVQTDNTATNYKNAVDLLSNSINDVYNRLQISSYPDTNQVVTFYVGSVLPTDGFKVYIQAGNSLSSGTATINVQYWSGSSWDNTSNIADGTAASGRSLEQTGTVTFDSTAAVAKQTIIESVCLFWYKVTVTGESTAWTFTPYELTVSIPAQTISGKEAWDGSVVPLHTVWLNIGGNVGNKTQNAYALDYTTNVVETYVELSSLDNTNTRYVIIGHPDRLQGFTAGWGAEPTGWINSSASTLRVSYWSGSAWVPMTITDGTKNAAGDTTMTKDGIVSWTPPNEGSESATVNYGNSPGGDKPTTEQVPLYVYKIDLSSGATDANTMIDQIQGIPAPTMVRPHAFSVEHQTRLCLFDEYRGRRNEARCSAPSTVNVFMGDESKTFFLGSDDPLVAASSLYSRFGSTIADLLVVAKRNETWVLQGNGTEADPWRQYAASKTVGCVAPLTMASVPFWDDGLGAGLSRTVIVWLSDSGLVAFDGQNFASVTDAIADLFDPLHTNYIGAANLPNCTGWYDPQHREYHLVIQGTAEWVWDITKSPTVLPNGKKIYAWYQIDRTTGERLYAGFSVYDTNGIGYSYGLDNAGAMYRLEYGQTFDGAAIAYTFQTADLALHNGSIWKDTIIRKIKLVQTAKTTTANVPTLTHYGDSKTAGTTYNTFTASASGKRLAFSTPPDLRIGPYFFHGLKFTQSTSDENAPGFEPIFIGVYYETASDLIR